MTEPSTTQRDELARLISSRHTMAAVDAILAAGYTKPEPVDPAEVSIINGWLVQQANECTCGGGGPECGYHHESGCGYEPLINITEPLKQAGYTLDSKPRTITTAEELDALPDEALVRSDFGVTHEKRVEFDTGRVVWVCPGDSDEHTAGKIMLPATVLYEPEAEATQ